MALAARPRRRRDGDRALRAPGGRAGRAGAAPRRRPARDQSWFLFATTRAQLARTLFPLGGMPDKDAVRAEAARLGLEVAAKPDSQDICFVPIRPLRRRRGAPAAGRDGDLATSRTQMAQCWAGMTAWAATRWARRSAWAPPAGGQRVVVSLDAGTRRVVVGPRGTGTRQVRLREVNWLAAARRLALHGEAARPRGAACRQRDGRGGAT